MKHGVIVRADGGVSVFPWHGDRQAALTFEAWQESARPDWLPATLKVTEEEIPNQKWHGSNNQDRVLPSGRRKKKDNAFAWDEATSAVIVRMEDARTIHMARIRKARDDHPDWKQIDRARAIATEGPDIAGLQDVKRRADILRNLPAVVAPSVEAAATPEDLDAIWPEPLPPRD